ncbi:hypothetical protein [Streptacidiphilus sp. MAP5-3]|uniref:hypothetical protein n=1 Tax=unclassified Streptacidiphilus TaxID=2643834 RepID=UPI0035184B07
MHPATRRAAAATLAVSAAMALSACRSSGPAAGASATTSAVAAAPSPSASAHASATTSATVSATSSATATASMTATPSPTAAVCENLVATAAVKTAVTQAYGAVAHLDHIQPRAGGFLYGGCGGVMYAETRFTPTADATTNEQVALQDEGSSRKYFRLSSAGTWTYLGTGGFPDTGGCLSQIPSPMATIWNGCSTR